MLRSGEGGDDTSAAFLADIVTALWESDAPDRPGPPSTQEMVRYLAGDLSSEASAKVEASLTVHRGARAQFVTICQRVEAFRALPLSSLPPDDSVAAEWIAVLRDRSQAAREAGEWWGKSPKSDLAAFVAKGERVAICVASSLRALGNQLSLGALQPRFATVRDSEDRATVVGSDSEGVSAQVEAEVTSEGLSGTLTLVCAGKVPQSVRLELVAGPHEWPLALRSKGPGSFEFGLDRFAQIAGVELGLIPASAFRVTAGIVEPRTLSRATALLAMVFDSSGRAEPRAVSLELVGAPRREDGQLVIPLVIPPAARAECPGCLLRLEVALGGELWQNLGEWRIDELGEGPLELTVPDASEGDDALNVPIRVCMVRGPVE